jgi:alanyl-tRNA synthetase
VRRGLAAYWRMERPYSGDEIRETFLRFFTERRHARIEAASIVPANDPSLLFINAGMAPLKAYFLGEALPPAPDPRLSVIALRVRNVLGSA